MKLNYQHVIVAEEHNVIGGLYGAVCEALAGQNLNLTLEALGVKDG